MKKSKATLYGIYMRYLHSMMNLRKQNQKDGSWHVDLCNCVDCRQVRAYLDLTTWQQLKAKWVFTFHFIEYMQSLNMFHSGD